MKQNQGYSLPAIFFVLFVLVLFHFQDQGAISSSETNG